MSRFSGKHAIVTGGGRGIGEAVARRLYDEGAAVMVVSRTEAEVGAVAGALGERALAHVADVSLEADVQGIVDRAHEVWGRIDVVVNNAGIDDDCPFLDVQAENWQRVLGVNLTGPFLVSQRAARSMAASGGGAFVHIGSIAALAGDGEQVAYGASKAGLLGLIDQVLDPPMVFYRGDSDHHGTAITEVPYDLTQWKARSIAVEVADFVDAVRQGRPAAIDLEDAVYTVRLVEAAYESVATGLPIDVRRRQAP